MLAPEVSGRDVPRLIPGAPQPSEPLLTLARGWAERELTLRGVTQLSGDDAELYVSTAIAARALGMSAAVSGAVALAGTGFGKVIEQLKVPGQVEIKYALSGEQPPQLAEAQWDALSLTFLSMAVPVRTGRRMFAGVSR